jgi:hypothetical protein
VPARPKVKPHGEWWGERRHGDHGINPGDTEVFLTAMKLPKTLNNSCVHKHLTQTHIIHVFNTAYHKDRMSTNLNAYLSL